MVIGEHLLYEKRRKLKENLKHQAMAATLRKQILIFLSSDFTIKKINFQLFGKKYKVYPKAYRIDIYNAIKNNDIEPESCT